MTDTPETYAKAAPPVVQTSEVEAMIQAGAAFNVRVKSIERTRTTLDNAVTAIKNHYGDSEANPILVATATRLEAEADAYREVAVREAWSKSFGNTAPTHLNPPPLPVDSTR